MTDYTNNGRIDRFARGRMTITLLIFGNLVVLGLIVAVCAGWI